MYIRGPVRNGIFSNDKNFAYVDEKNWMGIVSVYLVVVNLRIT